jgi:hypothetical protein
MTVGQRLKLLRGMAGALVVSGVGLIISVAIGPNLLEAFQEGVILGIVATLFFLICAGMGLGGGLGAIAFIRDMLLGRTRSETGIPKLKRERATGHFFAGPVLLPYRMPGQFTYRLDISDLTFPISRELYALLSHDSGRVRAYVAANSGELLSLETLH